MLTAEIGLINPTDYWSTARSGGKYGLSEAMIMLQDEALSQLKQQNIKLPRRGEMMLYNPIDDSGKTDLTSVNLSVFSRLESYSTWIALGAGAVGLLAGVLIGRATKR